MFSPNNPKKAIIIGINYINSSNPLHGCINDVKNLKKFLIDNLYFNTKNIIYMSDNSYKKSYLPTQFNIKQQIKSMVKWANNNYNSELWFSFSGHGSNILDHNHCENKDEVLCTIDNNYIKHDWIRTNLINSINCDVKLFILIDACHSGTICDLTNNNKQIIMISGCRENQTSADVFIYKEGEYRGALTHSFLTMWKNNIENNITIMEYYYKLIRYMNGKYTQKPVLTTTSKTQNYKLC